jgi:hypothetical protein
LAELFDLLRKLKGAEQPSISWSAPPAMNDSLKRS